MFVGGSLTQIPPHKVFIYIYIYTFVFRCLVGSNAASQHFLCHCFFYASILLSFAQLVQVHGT